MEAAVAGRVADVSGVAVAAAMEPPVDLNALEAECAVAVLERAIVKCD